MGWFRRKRLERGISLDWATGIQKRETGNQGKPYIPYSTHPSTQLRLHSAKGSPA